MARPPSIRYQFLCGTEIAKEDRFAKQMANYCYLVQSSVLLNHVQVMALNSPGDKHVGSLSHCS